MNEWLDDTGNASASLIRWVSWPGPLRVMAQAGNSWMKGNGVSACWMIGSVRKIGKK